MTVEAELGERVRRYYERYYRDTLGLPDWERHVSLREHEETQERSRVARLRRLVGGERLSGRVLNVGCGTGGFNVALGEVGARAVGVDEGAEAIAICGLKQRDHGGAYARAAAEALPFANASFDLVYCFSTIEHVRSVEASIREMARVTRRGGAIYVHTPNAWSWYEGHYKLLWLPFMPRSLGRLYLRLRGRPTAYLDTLRRLTPGSLARVFRAAGVTRIVFFDDERPRELLGPLGGVMALYYRVTGLAPFVELVAYRP